MIASSRGGAENVKRDHWEEALRPGNEIWSWRWDGQGCISQLKLIIHFSGLCIAVSSPPAHGCSLALWRPHQIPCQDFSGSTRNTYNLPPSILIAVWPGFWYQSAWIQSCSWPPPKVSPSSQRGYWNTLLLRHAQGRWIETYWQSHVEIPWTIRRIVSVEICWTDHYTFGCICRMFWDGGSTNLGE